MPYIRRYRNQTFVLKIGGGVLADPKALAGFAAQIAFIEQLSIRPILVHGGGPQATELQKRLGIEPQIHAGRRVTDEKTLEVVKMVYGGLLNIEVLSALRAKGVRAVGLSGLDAGLVVARRRPPIPVRMPDGSEKEIDFGFVGDVNSDQIDTSILKSLGESGYVPVLSSLAADEHGQVLNINADTLASELAVALGAKKLVFLTQTDGLLRDVNDPKSLVPFADPDDLEKLVGQGVVKDGMLPKVKACVRAATNGVKRTHIINGMKPDSVLTELFTAEGCGTMIVGQREKAKYQEIG